MRRRSTLIGVVLSSATTLFPLSPVSAEGSLFSTDEILEITIRGPLKRLARSETPGTVVPGHIELGDGTKIQMVFSKYGYSRLEECGPPLLKIQPDEMQARGTPFEGFRVVRMVTPCHHGPSWDKYILLEYLAYRSYAVIAEPFLRVRLAADNFGE